MGFNDFLGAIESPALRDVAQHWNAARGAKRMPGWKDIDPVAIAPHLSIVWSWKYDKDSDTFTGRLSGEANVEALGGNLRGKRLQEFFDPSHVDGILEKYRRVVSVRALAYERGQVFIASRRYGLGERIIMPLTADRIQSDGIFGATVYTTTWSAPPDTAARQYLESGQAVFFSVD
jgi:hypothetical protein